MKVSTVRAHVAPLLFPSTQADRAGGKVSHKCHFSAFPPPLGRASVTASAFWRLTVAATKVVTERLPRRGCLFFFVFFYLCFRYGFDSSELVRGRPAESSTSCLWYSEWFEPTASLETRCAATSVFKTGNIRRNSALEGSGRADVRNRSHK